MSPPVLSPLGERLLDRTRPLAPADDEHADALALLCEALMLMLREIAEVWDPADPLPPGAPLLDPWLCPEWALPWLAQIVGVTLPAGASANEQRTLISDAAGWRRGTPGAISSLVGLYLTGSRTVFFRERDGGDPYALEIVTLTGETPDPAAVQAALLAAKPAGIVLSYRTLLTWDWQQVVIEHDTWAEIVAKYATWTDLVNRSPKP